jgi:hypothetical protein
MLSTLVTTVLTLALAVAMVRIPDRRTVHARRPNR